MNHETRLRIRGSGAARLALNNPRILPILELSLWPHGEDRGPSQHQAIGTTTSRNDSSNCLEMGPGWFDDESRTDANMACLRPFTN